MAVGSASIEFSTSGRGMRYPAGNTSIEFSTSGIVMRYPVGSTSLKFITTYKIQDSEPISIDLDLNITVSSVIPIVSEPISIDLDLDTTIGTSGMVMGSDFILMYGFLDTYIYTVDTYCMGTYYDFVPQKIIVELCNGEENDMIERYKDDTYPLEVVFSKNGNHDISAYTFSLYTQLDGDSLYTSTGTVVDADLGLVNFDFDTDATDVAGTGLYEIKAVDSDTTTFAHGVLTILDTLA